MKFSRSERGIEVLLSNGTRTAGAVIELLSFKTGSLSHVERILDFRLTIHPSAGALS